MRISMLTEKDHLSSEQISVRKFKRAMEVTTWNGDEQLARVEYVELDLDY